jgi:CRISPR system Cascade subunit CasE
MFVSLLQLNLRSRHVQSELRNPYQMHRTLSKAFGDEPGVWEAARVLFRVDETNGKLAALVQSKTLPDWSQLSAADSYLTELPKMTEFSPSVRKGQRLAFRLLANPTVKRDGKRVGLYKEEEQLQWLNRKAKDNGFRILSAVPTSQGKVMSKTAKGEETVLLAVRFDGALEVTDPDLFTEALESGIGSAKGFGFGLLSIAPLR